MSDIVWTKTDESPLLSSYLLLPCIKAVCERADISIKEVDISLSGRILAAFGLASDGLAELGELVKKPEANIIKLPNISASLPQLNAAIKELRAKGYELPDYPQSLDNDEAKSIAQKYAKVLGSAVNPVLREGNSDRRSTKAVKNYAKTHPHKMAPWGRDSKARVAHMNDGDFYANEKSLICQKDDEIAIKFTPQNGDIVLLKSGIKVGVEDVLSATFLDAAELDKFIEKAEKDARENGLLFSLHLKATMMKVSDPVIFGHALRVYFSELFDEFKDELNGACVNADNGLGDLTERVKSLPNDVSAKIIDKLNQIISQKAPLSMVNSDAGITGLHVPSDVIIDASMPALIRAGGKMWDKNGELKDALAVIPDRTYATLYAACIDDMKENGALDVSIAGSVSNVGLMAKKAEEYGSHDKTFIIKEAGEVELVSSNGESLLKFNVKAGDIFRAMIAKDEAIKSWVKLAINRHNASGERLIFWLDEARAHDANMIKKVRQYMQEFKFLGAYAVLDYVSAMRASLAAIRKGENVIGVTGNVLRDYLTDLFPILELGTSAKMLSIVPLLNGGGLFETGAGGSAPKLAQQLINENHLRWNSLGEYLALAASLEHLSSKKPAAKILANTLDAAIARWLNDDREPKSRVGEMDNRSSHFYLLLYWANELASSDLGDKFKDLAAALAKNEQSITGGLLAVQGFKVELGGYYHLDDMMATAVMSPSPALNSIIKSEI